MPRIFDLVECPDMQPRDLVRRLPESGSGDFRAGSRLIVREGQTAVWFRDGRALDTFGPGAYTLDTANVPLLAELVGAFYGGKSPFTAEVYFVNRRQLLDLKWGTLQPIALRDAELGMVRLRAFGTYAIQVADPHRFVTEIAGNLGLLETAAIEDYLRSILVNRLTALLGAAHRSLLELPRLISQLSEALRAQLAEDFAAAGLEVRALFVESLNPTEETQRAIDERAAMGAIGDLNAYLQFKAARALEDAAQQGGEGGAGGGLGLVAGLGMGGTLAGLMRQSLTSPPAAPALTAPPADVACAACGAANPAGAKFCSECGVRIDAPAACARCRSPLAPGARFCSDCGAPVATAGQPELPAGG